MKETTRGTRAKNRTHMLCMCFALAFAGLGCDKFFDIGGVLIECGTSQGIPGAQGAATSQWNSEQKQFSTDSAGTFHLGMNTPDYAHVTVTFSKSGYTDLTVEYYGIPADAHHVQLCMNRN